MPRVMWEVEEAMAGTILRTRDLVTLCLSLAALHGTIQGGREGERWVRASSKEVVGTTKLNPLLPALPHGNLHTDSQGMLYYC